LYSTNKQIEIMKAILLEQQKLQMKMFRKELSKNDYQILSKVVKYFNNDIDLMLVGEELSMFVSNKFNINN
jgi:hypothetical protein